MADNYNPVQTVAPPTASPDNLISTRANPEAMGAQVGQAIQKAGATGEEVANQQMAVQMQFQSMYNEQTASKNTMSFGDFISKQEAAFRLNQGQNAADALPGFQKAMQDRIASQAATIQSPLARVSFQREAENFYNRTISSAGSFVAEELTKGTTRSLADKQQLYQNQATNVPEHVGGLIPDVVDNTWKQIVHEGITDKGSQHALIEKNVGDVVYSAIVGVMAKGGTLQEQQANVQQAREMLNFYKKESIPDSPGDPVLGGVHIMNIESALSNKDWQLAGRADTETAHSVSDQVWNEALLEYNKANADRKPGEDHVQFADFLQNDISKWSERARQVGKDSTGRAVIGDESSSLAETRIRKYITDENEHDKVAVNKLQELIFNPDHLITSEKEVLASSAAQDWKDLEDRRPAVIKGFRKLFNANSAGKQLTYGTDFYHQFTDMTGKLETETKPTAEQYMHYVGPTRNDPLTNTGFQALEKERQYAMSSPEGAAFVHTERQYFDKLRTDIVGGFNTRNVNGEKIFNSAVIQSLKKIQAARDTGLTADQLFNPESKDYVGSAAAFDPRSPDQKIRDSITINSKMPMGPLVVHPAEKFDIGKIDAIKDDKQMKAEVKKALDNKDMTYDQAEAYLLKRGVPKAVPSTGLVPAAR